MIATSAHADVWGYVDDKGNTHFASRQVDDRYQLYFKTNSTTFSSAGAPTDAERVIRLPATSSSLKYNPAADVAAGQKARRLVALINQSKAFQRVRPTLQKEAARHGLDVNLVKAVAAAESGFNPYAVSPVGAVGLMQIMPDTARMLGLRADKDRSVEDKLTDTATNARLGTRYLSQLLHQFGGRTDLAVAAYNAGPGAVRKNMRVPPYTETQGYVRTVLAIYETLQPGALGSLDPSAIPLAVVRSGGKNNAHRKQMILAANKRLLMKPPSVEVAHITIPADAPIPVGPTALDTVAEKIANADQLMPVLDKDVKIKTGNSAPTP
ncbi:MAG: lytic transglycosylase domain-containing protein [Brachymonas sp.]|nr:lytic transglycosylase domain-containing protein [Brachymonas sp.]